ncbi:MAG: 50S ribosomal protein L25 [bacterium]
MAIQDNVEASELAVEIRTESGKGKSRKLRKNGKIPAVFYGYRAEPVSLTINPAGLREALDTPKKRNTLLKLSADDPNVNGRLVMVKDMQRHPLTRDFLHVDLMEVYEDRPLKVDVPLVIHGHAQGVDMGGTLEQHVRYLQVISPIHRIPASIDIDVSHLDINDMVKVGELHVHEGAEILDDEQATVVSVIPPRVMAEALPEEAAEEEAEGEEGEAAAASEEGEKEGESGGEE